MKKSQYLQILHSGMDKFIDERNRNKNQDKHIDGEQDKLLDDLWGYFDKHLNEDLL